MRSAIYVTAVIATFPSPQVSMVYGPERSRVPA